MIFIIIRVSNATVSVANVENAHHSTRWQRWWYPLTMMMMMSEKLLFRWCCGYTFSWGPQNTLSWVAYLLFKHPLSANIVFFLQVTRSNNLEKYSGHKKPARDPQWQGQYLGINAGCQHHTNIRNSELNWWQVIIVIKAIIVIIRKEVGYQNEAMQGKAIWDNPKIFSQSRSFPQKNNFRSANPASFEKGHSPPHHHHPLKNISPVLRHSFDKNDLDGTFFSVKTR